MISSKIASYKDIKKSQLYRLLIEEVKDYAICFLDLNGQIVLWNKGGVRLEGYKRSEVKGKPLEIFFTEEDRNAGLPGKLITTARKKGRAVWQGWSIRKNGSRFWSSVVLTAIYNKEDKLIGFTKIVRDLTEQDKERQDFKLLSESVPQLVWTADSSGNAFYFNQKWTEYSGLQGIQLKGTGWMVLVHPEEQEQIISIWDKAQETPRQYSIELRLRNEEGDYHWFLVRFAPILDPSGKVIRWFGTGTDIHKQKMEGEKKAEFVSFATHELRMPLTTIKAYISLLEECRKSGNDCDADKYLRKTHALVDRLNTLISEMHEITKAESGQLVLEKEDINLGGLVREFADTMQQTTDTHHIILDNIIDVTVKADRNKITQVLSNYITNAIKYSPKSDKIIVGMQVNDSEVTVYVKDFGIGIPRAKAGKIFDKFYRAKNARKYEGLGLGLYLVKQIIGLHKGRVWLESEEGKGSVFYFSLPLKE